MVKANTKTRYIFKAMIIGLAITLSTLAFEYKTTIMKYNDCEEICAAWVSSESEADARGYPMAIATTSNPGASYEETEVNIIGAVVDWALYSSLALIVIILLK